MLSAQYRKDVTQGDYKKQHHQHQIYYYNKQQATRTFKHRQNNISLTMQFHFDSVSLKINIHTNVFCRVNATIDLTMKFEIIFHGKASSKCILICNTLTQAHARNKCSKCESASFAFAFAYDNNILHCELLCYYQLFWDRLKYNIIICCCCLLLPFVHIRCCYFIKRG